MAVSDSPWDRVYIDYREHKGIHYLVLVDAYSKWTEVRYKSTTSQQTVEVHQDIFARHGFRRIFVSDNGPQFLSAEFASFLTRHHILHRTSAPYHPATNGLAENMVKMCNSGKTSKQVFHGHIRISENL